MTTHPRLTALAGAVLMSAMIAGCGEQPTPFPTAGAQLGQVLEKLEELAQQVRRVEDRIAGVESIPAPSPTSSPHVTPAPTPKPKAIAVPTPALPVPTPKPTAIATATPVLPTATPAPTPTPNPGTSPWIQQRLDAVIGLYDLTDAGAALVRSLDVRQMQGEPGWFGSYGFKEWAGVGEAKPNPVMHEISHSYWGGFPIEGFPELSWDPLPGGSLSTAMERYHADILAFMAQPPDNFEVFRQRLRNLPEVSADNPEPLLHNVEASLLYDTGGNLALVPPILRKYWSRFLKPGPFDTWYDAVAWYRSLPDEDRSVANKYLGFEHLDLREYTALLSSESPRDYISIRRDILVQEERQRLYDLAEQFDLLLGDSQKEEDFQFWRGYLRDKVELHRQHEGYLNSLVLARATDLAAALGFLTELSGLSPEEQALRVADQLEVQPFVVNFLPALENRALLALFSSETPLPEGRTLQATASFVDRLNRFSTVVDKILVAGRNDPQSGTSELTQFLSDVDFEQKDDLRLFFDLFLAADPDTAKALVRALEEKIVRRLMDPVPSQLRGLLSPGELLAMLDITPGSDASELQQGITLLVEEPTGNYRSDEPYLHVMYEVVAARSRTDSRDIMRILRRTPFPLEGFIERQPRAALAVLTSDMSSAVRLVRSSDRVLSPPSRIVYRLINADPEWAAQLVVALAESGEEALVTESLAYIAYDKDRLERLPELPISLENDGEFLEALLIDQGPDWLLERLNEAYALSEDRTVPNHVPDEFQYQYLATLEAAVATVPYAVTRIELQRIINQVAQNRG
ncbi:MAG: hypothetical protein J4N89_09235 [Chloroflexi bacterium]|nr:hypothetical protein [Chloroflexota bacterium]